MQKKCPQKFPRRMFNVLDIENWKNLRIQKFDIHFNFTI